MFLKRPLMWVLLGVLGYLAFALIGSIMFCPGGYGNAKSYNIQVDYDTLHLAIEQLKREHPEICPSALYEDGKDDWFEATYFFYFRQPGGKVVLTRISGARSKEGKKIKSYATSLYLISYADESTGGFRSVGKWCGLIYKSEIVDPFEQTILALIHAKLRIAAG
jgi:hypothetical protein